MVRAASATVRVIGPMCDTLHTVLAGYAGMRPKDGLCRKMPANDAGMRMEPPPSVPIAIGARPAATAAEAPPLDPPGVRSRRQGFRVSPKTRLWVAPSHPNAGVLVFPIMMPPAAFRRVTIGASSVGTLSAWRG